MEITPRFVFASGIATTVGFLPHLLFLTVIALSNVTQHAPGLIMFTMVAKLFGEWIFWSCFFNSRMNDEPSQKNWRTIVDRSFFMRPVIISPSLHMLFEGGIDMILMVMALKIGVSPVLICLVLAGSQALFSPVHGIISELISKRSHILFSMIVSFFAVMLSMEICRGASAGSYLHFFKLEYFVASTQILIVIGAKGLLSSNTVTAKAMVAEEIRDAAKERNFCK